MFLSSKTFFANAIPGVTALIIRAETAIPMEFIRHYKKNVVSLTPMKSGALRRSIITQALGKTASISWRSPYAGIQNAPEDFGRVYLHYTTPGTGSHFANIAFQRTQDEMPAVLNELGIISV